MTAPSAYINFCKEQRDKVKAKNPSATFGELGKLLGVQWGALSDKEKAVSDINFFNFFEYRFHYHELILILS